MLAGRRDRWFVGDGATRTGPLHLEQLVQLLLAEADPLAPLVWHKGFACWTRARDVPEVEGRLAPVLARAAVPADSLVPSGSAEARLGESIGDGRPGSPTLVYGSLAAGAIALALLGWIFWPRPQPAPVLVLHPPEPPSATPVPAPSPDGSRSGTRSPAPPEEPPAVAALEAREAELPRAALPRLRGVAAWSGETLALTVENRTAWRITELRVRVSRLDGDDLVSDAAPVVLLPPTRPVAPGVTDLLDRVAPDRKRPGLNPLDTGSFEGTAGPRPEGFRWEIESARGYAPR